MKKRRRKREDTRRRKKRMLNSSRDQGRRKMNLGRSKVNLGNFVVSTVALDVVSVRNATVLLCCHLLYLSS